MSSNQASIFVNIKEWLVSAIPEPYSVNISTWIILAGIFVAAWLAFRVAKWVLRLVERQVQKSASKWDDHLLTPRLNSALSQLVPALAVSWLLPGFFGDSQETFHWLRVATSVYILWAYIRIVCIFIDNLFEALRCRPKYHIYAVKGLFQTIKVVAVCVGILICCSILFGRGPVTILTTLGATAGVLMLVFKDTILGFVASVQLSGNKMLHVGDWIVAEKFGANGEVLDITLTTVKVRNWDNSISTIPPYSLISDSFRNYQPMRHSGGRRVDRAVFVDANSVRFCTAAELERLGAGGWLEGLDIADPARVVNLHLLRKYLEHYLETHPDINHTMLTMVRQLEPTNAGLPLQLYFFANAVEWKAFEHVQSDIFDHVYAVVAEFGLRIYQSPAGADIASLSAPLR